MTPSKLVFDSNLVPEKTPLPDGMAFRSFIDKIPSFHQLATLNKQKLGEQAELLCMRKGEILWKKHDHCDFCVLIVSGLVEVTSCNEEGDESVFGIFGPQDLVGIAAVLRKSEYSATAVVASKECRLYKLRISTLPLKLSDAQRDNFLKWECEMLLLHEQILRGKIAILGAGRLHSRLVEMFTQLGARFGDKQSSTHGQLVIPIPLTKTLIAKVVEARVESVIRMLKKWEKAGYLKMDRDEAVVVQLDRLQVSEP